MNDLLKFPLARQDQVRRCRWGLGLEGLQLGSRSARPLLALVAFDAGMADRSRRGLLFGETGPILAKRMSRGRLGIVRVKTLPCACAGGFEDGAMDGCNAQISLKNSEIEGRRKSRIHAPSVVYASRCHSKAYERVARSKAGRSAEPLRKFPLRLPAVL